MNQLELTNRILHQVDMRFTLIEMNQEYNRLAIDVNNMESQSNGGIFLAGHTLLESKQKEIEIQIKTMTEDRVELEKILSTEMKELLAVATRISNES